MQLNCATEEGYKASTAPPLPILGEPTPPRVSMRACAHTPVCPPERLQKSGQGLESLRTHPHFQLERGQNWSSQSTEKAKLKVAILSPAAAQMEAPERTCAPGLSPHQAPPLALLSWPNLPSLPDPPPSFLSHISAPLRTVRLNPTSTLHSQELSH